ncbi:SPX and EXS domain containing protein [Pseudohyphozyma bogoriensis]|nr:SPX and EXS domain containing protein [Pseudohyphozyma bogoriensis]
MADGPHVKRARSAASEVLLVVCIAGVSFLNSFFNGSLTASLPTIQRDLSISSANLQWSVSLYALVLGSFLLPSGRLADVHGHRPLFLVGTALFAVLSVMVAVSRNWQMFTTFAALLGLGAATNTPAGVGVLGAHFDPGEAKNRAFASLGAGQPLGFISGLVVGAILTETKAGWRASFYVQAGLTVIFWVIAYFTIPATFTLAEDSIELTAMDVTSPAGTPGTPGTPALSDAASVRSTRTTKSINPTSGNNRVDWIGIVLSVLGFVMLIFSLSDAPSEPKGWATPFIPPLLVLSILTLAAFFYWQIVLQRKGVAYLNEESHPPGSQAPPPPLLQPSIWTRPFISQILAITFCAWSGFNTSSYFANLLIQKVYQATPIKTALYFLPMVCSGTILNLIPGFLLGRVDGKLLIVLSLLLSLVGPVLLAVVDVKATYWQYLFPMMVFLPGPDLSYAIAAIQISRSVTRSEQATAGALFSVVTRLATAISLGLLSTVSNSVSSTYLEHHPLSSELSPNSSESPEVLLAGYRVGGGWACAAFIAVGVVQYVNYRILKKLIGKAEKELEGEDEAQESPQESDENERGRQDRDVELGLGGGGARGGGESEAQGERHGGRDGDAADDEDEDDGEPEVEADDVKPTTRPLSPAAKRVASDSHILSEDSSGGVSEVPTATTQQSQKPFFRRDSYASTTTQRSATEQPPTSARPTSRRRDASFAITAAGELNPKRWREGYPPTMSLPELYDKLPKANRKFFTVLDRELDRVSSFYQEREDDAVKRFQDLSSQWRELAEHKREYQAFKDNEAGAARVLAPIASAVPGLPGSKLVRRTLGGKPVARINQQTEDHHPERPFERQTPPGIKHGRPEDYSMAKSKLKLATYEYYRSLGILKSYRVLNTTGFAKALKKYEKSTRIPCSKVYKSTKLATANFEKSDKLDELIRETEDAFTSVFEHGDRKKALERLRDSGASKAHHFSTWRAGMLLGMAVPLFLEGLVKSCSATTQREIPYWPALMQMFGAMFLPVLFALLFMCNLLAWHSSRINYVLIFEFDIRTRLDIHQYLEIPSLLFFILSLFFWMSFSNFWPDHIAPYSYPLAFLVVAMVLLLSPFPWLHPSARWWLARSFTRVFSAGLVRVEFRDFFLGDELNSLYYVFYNFGFLICTYGHHWANDVNMVCSTNLTWTSPVLASLPAGIRLGQSIRRYFDSDGLIIHLLNAGKYTASIFYFYFYFAWRIYGSHSGWRKALFILFGTLNSCYVTVWDLIMDWSLFRRGSKRLFLRPELGFKDHQWIYYVAIVLNVILRFSWTFYLIPSHVPSVQFRGFLVALAEVLRRIMWNAFRVESEHIGNVDGYRVTRDVPLPYVMPGTTVERDLPDAELELDSRTRKERFFGFFHNLHTSISKDLASIPLPSLQTSHPPPSRQHSTRSRDRRPSTNKIEMDSSTADSDGRGGAEDDDDDSDDALKAQQAEAEEIQRAGERQATAEAGLIKDGHRE